MKYKIGDKVRVRKDLVVGKSYGSYIFSSDMKGLKGKIFTIQKVGSDYYRVEEESFFWVDEMFEPVITNWDKVKEEMRIEDLEDIGTMTTICNAIHRTKKEKNCPGRSCSECKDWLKQAYKEPSILDEAEKKYLSAVIRPWRDKVKYIQKEDIDGEEFIAFQVGNEWIELPNFDAGTMYKEMELNKEYTLDELDL